MPDVFSPQYAMLLQSIEIVYCDHRLLWRHFTLCRLYFK